LPRINIEIDDTVSVVKYQHRSSFKVKTVLTDELINAFASQGGIEVPDILPPGTRYYKRNGSIHTLILEIPPVQRLIRYVNSSHKVIFEGFVPMPWALMQINANYVEDRFIVSSAYLYALVRPLMSMTDTVYHFPGANIFPEDKICWGNTLSGMPPLRRITEFGRLVDIYFGSEFNTDLHPRIQQYSRYEDMLRALKDQKTFPTEVLVANTVFQHII